MLKLLPYLLNPILMSLLLFSFLLICLIAFMYYLKSTKNKTIDSDKAEIEIADILMRNKNRKPHRGGRV